jgi:hypothetical protein
MTPKNYDVVRFHENNAMEMQEFYRLQNKGDIVESIPMKILSFLP